MFSNTQHWVVGRMAQQRVERWFGESAERQQQ